MAVASAPAPPSPAMLAEEIINAERELRRVLPSASPEVQTLALQVLDLPQASLLDPKLVSAFSSPDILRMPDGPTALAAWTKFAQNYLEMLLRLQRLATREAAS